LSYVIIAFYIFKVLWLRHSILTTLGQIPFSLIIDCFANLHKLAIVLNIKDFATSEVLEKNA
jgi:hypothetical protein